MTSSYAELEGQVRAACTAGDFQVAATLLLQTFGSDLVRFIHNRFRDEQATAEVFSQFAEDLWLGLPKYRFECPLRAWLFILARNAGSRYLKRDLAQMRALRPLSEAPEVAAMAKRLGTETLLNLRTPTEQRFAELRAELSADEQELLTLRVDRELDFAEIALIALGEPSADAAAVGRESAKLRKRFQVLKERLRQRWLELSQGE